LKKLSGATSPFAGRRIARKGDGQADAGVGRAGRTPTLLPDSFLVTPANAQESVLAIPLLVLAVPLFGFPILIVRADAGYFAYAILNFIRVALHAGFVIDYNLRRRGKHFLATSSF
jgi:hypothetical protein